ncbi:Hsp20/alpha crystallin family protein [Verrucomicrobiota bacterium]
MYHLVTWPRDPWSIFDELDSLQEDMNRVFGGHTRAASGSSGRSWRRRPFDNLQGRRPAYPLMNVWSSADGVVIDAELPGVDPKDVDISVTGDEVTLRGKVNGCEPGGGEKTCRRRERPTGEFARTLQLPFRANAGAVKASYKDGMLRLSVPRSEDEKPRKIQIEG